MTSLLVMILAILSCFLYEWLARLFSWPSWKKLRAFQEKWPPINDAEFLQRCPSDLDPEIALKVRNTLADVMGIDPEEIHPEHSLLDLEFLACG